MKNLFMLAVLLLAANASAIEVLNGTVLETEGTHTLFIVGDDFNWSSLVVEESFVLIDEKTISFQPESGEGNVTIEAFDSGAGEINFTISAPGELYMGLCGLVSDAYYSLLLWGEVVYAGLTNSSGCFTYTRNVSEAVSFDIIQGGVSTTTTTAVTTTTTTLQCVLVGDFPECGVVTLQEVIDFINLWSLDQAALQDVVALISAWAES